MYPSGEICPVTAKQGDHRDDQHTLIGVTIEAVGSGAGETAGRVGLNASF
jgi:hypothetical protein